MLPEAVETDPGGLALDDLTRTRTWAELGERATRVGHLLRDELGIPPGGHAAMIMGNRVEFIELYLGAVMAGVWLTPINWHLTAEEAEYIIGDSGSAAVIADPDYADTAKAAAGDRPLLVAGDELDLALAGAGTAPFAPDSPGGGAMLYTSGTTGRPKGVKRTRQTSIAAQARAAQVGGQAIGLDGRGPHLVTGPLYHASPLGFSAIDLQNGAPLVIMPRWDEQTALELIDARRVAGTHMVPTMFVRLLRLPDDIRDAFDGSSLKAVLHGAAPISIPVKRRMIDWWGDVIVEYWGGSEGGVVTLVRAADWLEHPGTVGRAVPGHEVFATAGDGTPLPAGQVGTLWCRNQLVEKVFEYHNAPEKTANAFRDANTYTLGDIGRVDEDGFVYLADRAANMIISGGVNIYPAEIEQVLIEHPAVADAAVFGIPDDEWGESVKGAVELVDGYAPSPELEAEILAFAREHLAGYKVPRSIDFEDALPRYPTGKLYTRVLRDRYWQGLERSI